MLFSITIVLLVGIFANFICNRLQLPSLVGYLIGGIIIGPSTLDLLDNFIINASVDIRQTILIIILTRAGLSLNIDDLKQVGRPAILLSFLPATFEIIGVVIFGKIILNLDIAKSLLLGSVLAAVSPAVVTPRMITLINEKYGTKKGIPQLILAGASIDDVYALVLFSAFLALNQTGHLDLITFTQIPISIFSGIISGVLIGYLLSKLLNNVKLEPIMQVLVLLSISLLITTFEQSYPNVPFSSLLAIMSFALIVKRQNPKSTKKIAHIYNQMWIIGEMFLFVLVGASVSISYAFKAGFAPTIVILLALIIRMIGVYLSLLKTNLNASEKTFIFISYIPKATVQAAIGGIPLTLNLPAGELILTTSVLAILITAPLGAILIDKTYQRLLQREI